MKKMFESSVDSEGSKTLSGSDTYDKEFESSVDSEGSKTRCYGD